MFWAFDLSMYFTQCLKCRLCPWDLWKLAFTNMALTKTIFVSLYSCVRCFHQHPIHILILKNVFVNGALTCIPFSKSREVNKRILCRSSPDRVVWLYFVLGRNMCSNSKWGTCIWHFQHKVLIWTEDCQPKMWLFTILRKKLVNEGIAA